MVVRADGAYVRRKDYESALATAQAEIARLTQRAEKAEAEQDAIAAAAFEAAAEPVPRVDELATIIRMLVRHVPDDKQIKGTAVDYLRRHGLQGSPLRETATPSDALAARDAAKVAEGREKGMREAAGLAEEYWRDMHNPDQRGPVYAAILAAIQKEGGE